MDNDVQMFAQVMAVIICSVGALVVIAGMARFIFFRPRAKAPKALPPDDDRMRRLEEAVDAIAVEVERISEGQRFTTRLLAERVPELAPLSAEQQSARASS